MLSSNPDKTTIIPPTRNNSYWRSSFSFSLDYPIKYISFDVKAKPKPKKATLYIETWNIIDLIQIKKFMESTPAPFCKLEEPLPFNLMLYFDLSKGGNEAALISYVNILFDRLGHLSTRDGIALRTLVELRQARDKIHAGIIEYCRYFYAYNSELQSVQTTTNAAGHEIKLDPNQQALLSAIQAGIPIIHLLRSDIRLDVSADFEGPYFLSQALPKISLNEENRDLTILRDNINALVEFGAPIRAKGDALFHTILARLLCVAYIEEKNHHVDMEKIEEFKKHLTALPDDDGDKRDVKRFIREKSQNVRSYLKQFRLYQDLIQLFMFLDNEYTLFSPIPQDLMASSPIFNWVAQGQQVVKLAKQLPAKYYRSIPSLCANMIYYSLSPAITIMTPAFFKFETNDARIIEIESMSLATAWKNPGLIQQLLDIYCRQFNVDSTRNDLIQFFITILRTNQQRAYLDIARLDGKIHGFNIGKFIQVQKDHSPALIYHGVLAAADNEITHYKGLMAYIIYFRGFLPLENGISLEVLTVIEAASFASYLQLISMGIKFNPQYNILGDWLAILVGEIYSKEELYRHEEIILDQSSYLRISDPLANFSVQTHHPWKTRRTTLAAARMADTFNMPARESITKYDVVAFFKCDKTNHERFLNYTQSAVKKRSKL